MADIVVTAFTPSFGAGRALRTYAIVAALARAGHVRLVFQRFGADEPDAAYTALENVSFKAVDPSRGLRRLRAVSRARRSGAPADLARGVSRELGAAAAALRGPGDRVIAEGPIAALALAQELDPGGVIYAAQNLEIDIDPRMERVERYLLRNFQETWLPTHRDMDGAAGLEPAAALRYAPNVVDVAAIAPATGDEVPGRILYAADFGYAPNREGLRFLVDSVMPALWDTRPEAKLVVCGRHLELEPGDPRVEALGFVDDIGAQYRHAAVIAVPMLRGGGSPLKLIEALAYGKAVVATEHAAGLIEHAHPGRELLCASSAEEIARALERVLDGQEPKLGARARALAEREYSIEALADHLLR